MSVGENIYIYMRYLCGIDVDIAHAFAMCAMCIQRMHTSRQISYSIQCCGCCCCCCEFFPPSHGISSFTQQNASIEMTRRQHFCFYFAFIVLCFCAALNIQHCNFHWQLNNAAIGRHFNCLFCFFFSFFLFFFHFAFRLLFVRSLLFL